MFHGERDYVLGPYRPCFPPSLQPYAQQMMEVISAEPLLSNTSDALGRYATKPDYRPLTKFENRGLKLGHGVWDLVFRRV